MTASHADSAHFDLEHLSRQAESLLQMSAAPQTEISFTRELDRFVRFAERGPTQAADRQRTLVSVRARIPHAGGGFSEARVQAVGEDPKSWQAALERAHDLARVSPVDEAAPELGGAVEVESRAGDEATLRHSFDAKAKWVDLALRAAQEHDLGPAGLARTGGQACVIVNSAGRSVGAWASSATFSLTSTGAGGAGIGVSTRGAVGELDPEAAIQRSVQKACLAQNPRPLEAGDYPALLEPMAVSAPLLFASYRGFGAREYAQGDSFLSGRQGQRILAPQLSISDDATAADAPGLPFDGEGSPRRVTKLVDRGVLGSPVTDARYAAKLGLPCTGHALPQPNDEGPQAGHLVVGAGDMDEAQLLACIDRGLLITQFHYTNLIDPRELMLTGMTRNGTYWIEDGEVQYAVKNLRFTDSLLRFFSNISGIGRTREVSGALFDGQVLTPSIAVPSLRFTSSTDH